MARTRLRGWWSALRGLGVVAVVLAVTGGPALAFALSQGPPSGGGPPRTVRPDVDQRVQSLAERLQDRYDTVPGYGTVYPDASQATVVVRWQGEVPIELQQLSRRGSGGLAVRVLQARYSTRVLQQAARRLDARAGAAGIPVVRVGPRTDSSGLVATVNLAAAGMDSAQATAWLRAMTPVDVIAVDMGPNPGAQSRSLSMVPR